MGDTVRTLFVLALLGMTAACVPPPEAAASSNDAAGSATTRPVLLFGVTPWPPPAPVATAAPPPMAAPAPSPVPAFYIPNPFAWLFAPLSLSAPAGQVTLSNFSYDTARVETLVTPFADCAPRPGTAASDFALPLNGTRVIQAMPGADVCWRRALASEPGQRAPVGMQGWTEWNRVYTSSGGIIDSQL